MLLEADLLVHRCRLVLQVRLVLAVHVAIGILFGDAHFISQPLQSQVRKVLALVYPVSDGALDLEHDRDQYLLDHLRVLHALRVSQDLLDGRVHLGASRSHKLNAPSEPFLYLAHHRAKLQLVDPLLHLEPTIPALLHGPSHSLDANCCIMAHL